MSNDSSSKTVAKDEAAKQAGDTKHWPWHPIVAVALAISLFLICQLFAGIIASIVITVAKQAGHPLGSVLQQFMLMILAEGIPLAALIWLLRANGKNLASIGLTKPKLKDIGYAIAGFLSYLTVIVSIVAIVSVFYPSLGANQTQEIGFSGTRGFWPLIAVFISLVILPPLTEEALFRGFVFTNVRARSKFLVAAIVTSVIFGAAHLTGGTEGSSLLWVAAFDTFTLSVVACYLREKTGRLWAGIGVHAMKNGYAFVLIFILHSQR